MLKCQALVPQLNPAAAANTLFTENTISYAQMAFNRIECIRHALHTKPTTSISDMFNSKSRISCFSFSTYGCHIVLLLTLICKIRVKSIV